MSSARYERLPTSPVPAPSSGNARNTTSFELGDEEAHVGRSTPPANRVAFAHDPRFDLPTPPPWQRAALVLFVVFLFWLGYKLRGSPAEEGIPAFVE